MGRQNGKSYIQEMKDRQLDQYNKQGGKRKEILQWKDLPPQVKLKLKDKPKKA
tara:strand:- start:589 stop:747 length:159 start_codon:yes stop_codon:yes gene_type:complete